MVCWDTEKNAYIMGALLAELNIKMNDQLAQKILTSWPTSTLGEAPTLRAVKDQVKKLATGGNNTAAKKTANNNGGGSGSGGGAAKKAKGRGKKRGRKDDDSEEDDDSAGGSAGQEGDEDEEEIPAKKVKRLVKQEKEDSDAEV